MATLPLRAAASLGAAALLLAGCPQRTAPADAGVVANGAPGRRGLRVPLPEGWTAEVDARDALVIGPPGRAVLRIARAEAREELPSAEQLEALFASEVPDATIRTLQAQDADQGSLWVGQVSPKRPGRSPWKVALAARRVGEEIFLCATLPGARDPEIDAAVELCKGLDGPSP